MTILLQKAKNNLFYFSQFIVQSALANKLVPRALLAEYFLEKLNRNNFFKKVIDFIDFIIPIGIDFTIKIH